MGSAVAVLVAAVIAGGAVAGRWWLGGQVSLRGTASGSSSSVTGGAASSGDPAVHAMGDGDPAGMPGMSEMAPGGTAAPTMTEPAATASSASGSSVSGSSVSGSSASSGSAGLTAADRAAGLLEAVVPQRGNARLAVVPGSSPAPGRGPVKRVRVDVEGGLPVDGAAFAAFVLDTLNDPRGWGHGGRMTFARSSGAYDIRVVLASPDTSARLCAPLQTMGTLSCGKGSTAVLTWYRWVKAIPDYGTDRTGYRRYVVNHEVGHTLGHGHAFCPGPGRPAPLMMQQTKGLKSCRPNSWPYP
jgi:hypothetical protein